MDSPRAQPRGGCGRAVPPRGPRGRGAGRTTGGRRGGEARPVREEPCGGARALGVSGRTGPSAAPAPSRAPPPAREPARARPAPGPLNAQGVLLEDPWHIYGDSERQGRLLPGPAQHPGCQVSSEGAPHLCTPTTGQAEIYGISPLPGGRRFLSRTLARNQSQEKPKWRQNPSLLPPHQCLDVGQAAQWEFRESEG